MDYEVVTTTPALQVTLGRYHRLTGLTKKIHKILLHEVKVGLTHNVVIALSLVGSSPLIESTWL